jgi:hypothetical protein
LRATDVRFLNDALELKYAWEEFTKTLVTCADEQTEFSQAYAAELEAIKAVKAENIDLMDLRTFSVCLSELADDIPQWRSYAVDGHGVALGFDARQILALKVPYGYRNDETGKLDRIRFANSDQFLTWPATLGKVVYGSDERAAAINLEIERIEKTCGTNDVSSLEAGVYNCIWLIPEQLAALARIKHEGFKSEQEWRPTLPEHFPSGTQAQ